MGLFLALALIGTPTSAAIFQAADKPITMREELITMEEFGQKLQTASGVTIEIPRPYRERKLDIFVDDLPLNRVLKGVGDALRGYWQKTDTGYRFEIETQQRNLEERLRQIDEVESAEQVEAFFLAADALKEIGPDQFNMNLAIEWRNKKTRGMDPAAPGAQKYFKAFDVLTRTTYPGLGSIPGLLVAGQMSTKERQQFLDGEAFYVSSNSTNLASKPRLAGYFEKQYGPGTFLNLLSVDPGSRSATILTMRTPNSDKLQLPLMMQSNSLFSGSWISSSPTGLEGTPYGEALKKWETEEEIRKTLDFKLKNVPNLSRGDYQNGYFRAADSLKFLNLYGGLNCIAEGNRRYTGNHPLRPLTSKAYEVLTRSYDPTFAHLHWEKTASGPGLLVVRDAAHWRNVREPSEKVLRWAESRVVDKKLSKEDWGTLAANLSVSEFARLGNLALKLPSSPDVNKWLALRLYGSLTAEQKAAPSVSLASLSPAQRSMALSAFLRILGQNASSENGIHQAVIDGEFEGAGVGKLNIYLVRTESWFQKTPFSAYDNPNVSPKFPDDYEKRSVEELRLGTSAKNSIGIGL